MTNIQEGMDPSRPLYSKPVLYVRIILRYIYIYMHALISGS
jgi:hypothetical protein